MMVKYLVVDAPFPYNVILGRPGPNKFQAVVSTHHLKLKFLTRNGIGEARGDQAMARECYLNSVRADQISLNDL